MADTTDDDASNLKKWLPFLGKVALGAGILVLLYYYTCSSSPSEKEKKEVCLRIDPSKKRWLTEAEEKELKEREAKKKTTTKR